MIEWIIFNFNSININDFNDKDYILNYFNTLKSQFCKFNLNNLFDINFQLDFDFIDVNLNSESSKNLLEVLNFNEDLLNTFNLFYFKFLKIKLIIFLIIYFLIYLFIYLLNINKL